MKKINGKQRSVTPRQSNAADAEYRSNAMNPNSLKAVEDAAVILRSSLATPRHAEPSLPRQYSLPSIGPVFQSMATATGICPHEIKQIVEKGFNAENELIVSAFKKFLAAVKISEEIDFSELNREKRHIEDNNREAKLRYQRAVELAAHNNELREQAIKSTQGQWAKAWGALLIDFMTNVQRNPRLESLGPWDRYLAEALSKHTLIGKPAVVIKNKTVMVDFQVCKTLDHDAVEVVFSNARRAEKQAREEAHSAWLQTAPLEELSNHMWNCGDEVEAERVAFVIAGRSGQIMTKDRWGNLQFSDHDQQDEYGQPLDDWTHGNQRDDTWADAMAARQAIQLLKNINYRR